MFNVQVVVVQKCNVSFKIMLHHGVAAKRMGNFVVFIIIIGRSNCGRPERDHLERSLSSSPAKAKRVLVAIQKRIIEVCLHFYAQVQCCPSCFLFQKHLPTFLLPRRFVLQCFRHDVPNWVAWIGLPVIGPEDRPHFKIFCHLKHVCRVGDWH